jgi:peroxiredoxin Q/BCP
MQDEAGSRTKLLNHARLTEISNCQNTSFSYPIHNKPMPAPQPLESGQSVPPFSYTEDGVTVHSSALNAAHLIYFYPKDDTPGCTKEACAIRDNWSAFESAGLKVVGVSKDPYSSHEKFRAKYELPFPLIADADLVLAQAFGVYGEKKFMGRVYDGVHRMSFLVSADGRILQTYPKVKPDAHAEQVLQDFEQLS